MLSHLLNLIGQLHGGQTRKGNFHEHDNIFIQMKYSFCFKTLLDLLESTNI